MRITKCKQSLLAKTTLLTVLAMMPVAVATAGSTHDPRDIASVLASNTSASEVSKSPVQLKDGRLSVSVVNQPLASVLDEISRKTRVAITRADGVGEQSTSIRFEDLTIEEGLRRILSSYDAFFFYGGSAERKTPGSLMAVWVYPKGHGATLQPVPPEQWASTKELKDKLSDPDYKVRAQAIEGLVEREGNRARDDVLKAMKDSDDSVRTRALYSAQTFGIEISPDSLKNMAVNDRSPEVRFLALDGLGNGPDARAIAERALNDPDIHVRNRAKEILHLLEGAKRIAQRPPQDEQAGMSEAFQPPQQPVSTEQAQSAEQPQSTEQLQSQANQ